MATKESWGASIASAERIASRDRLVFGLVALSVVIQILTFIMMLAWQNRATAKLEADLRVLQVYNQTTRERLAGIEERLKDE